MMGFEAVNPAGSGLVAYLQRLAFPEEDASLMRTYLVRDNDTDELSGYFSLKAGLVTFDEVHDEHGSEFDTIPGVELADFAVNGAYRRNHPMARGCGKVIFHDLVLEAVRRASSIVGIAAIYIYSLPEEKVISNYRGYGFSRLSAEREKMLHERLKPRYDKQCIFMFMPIGEQAR